MFGTVCSQTHEHPQLAPLNRQLLAPLECQIGNPVDRKGWRFW